MQISSAQIGMAAERAYAETRDVRESLEVWVGNRNAPPSTPASARDRLTLSDEAKAYCAQESPSVTDPDEMIENDPKLMLLKLMVEALSGHKIRTLRKEHVQGKPAEGDMPATASAAPGQSAPASEGWGLRYHREEILTESEQLSFSAKGVVNTADGQQIEFNLNLSLSRESVSRETLDILAGDAAKIDPLVINFAGTAADLTDMQFDFDLDADGATEKIPFLTPGSGFLAFDRNGDGVVNDGSELFGPQSGNGFTELAAYDADGNAWIDENDPVFRELAVWTKATAEENTLTSLEALGIGALHINAADGRFDLMDAQNRQLGQVNRLGVFLREDGSVGSMQQIDLVV